MYVRHHLERIVVEKDHVDIFKIFEKSTSKKNDRLFILENLRKDMGVATS